MTGALLMAAFAERDVEVQFMVGARPDLAQVLSGSERRHPVTCGICGAR